MLLTLYTTAASSAVLSGGFFCTCFGVACYLLLLRPGMQQALLLSLPEEGLLLILCFFGYFFVRFFCAATSPKTHQQRPRLLRNTRTVIKALLLIRTRLVYIYCIPFRLRMDQASHNLLMAVGGWGVLLPPCYRTDVLAYHSVP